MFFVYVLLSAKDKQFYIGYSRDVDRRLEEHNAGGNVSTASRRPLILIYYEGHDDEFDARRRENYFKSTKGKSTLQQMLRCSLVRHGYGKSG